LDDNDGWQGRFRRTAKFEPKRLDDLRDCMRPYIGRVFHFEYAGHSNDDDSYPGQSRWTIIWEEDRALDEDAQGRWFPSEDLVDV
jgi:hypothetical protein